MNPRTRRLRRIRRRERKREEMVLNMLRRGYPRLKLAVELATKFPSYTFRVLATFDLKDEEQKRVATGVLGRPVVEALTEKNPKPLESNAWSSKEKKRRG
jgi:hypothetical protein